MDAKILLSRRKLKNKFSKWWLYSKIIIVDIQKRFRVIVFYKNVYFAWGIVLNKDHGDFEQSYVDVISFARESKIHRCDTYIETLMISNNNFI